MTEQFHILDAFVDGESVDPSALRQALADEAGRDYLIDAWLLRDLVQEELADDEVATPARTAARTATPPRRRWLAAAAVAVLCLTGGYFAGRMTGTTGTRVRPVQTGTAGTAVTQYDGYDRYGGYDGTGALGAGSRDGAAAGDARDPARARPELEGNGRRPLT